MGGDRPKSANRVLTSSAVSVGATFRTLHARIEWADPELFQVRNTVPELSSGNISHADGDKWALLVSDKLHRQQNGL